MMTSTTGAVNRGATDTPTSHVVHTFAELRALLAHPRVVGEPPLRSVLIEGAAVEELLGEALAVPVAVTGGEAVPA